MNAKRTPALLNCQRHVISCSRDILVGQAIAAAGRGLAEQAIDAGLGDQDRLFRPIRGRAGLPIFLMVFGYVPDAFRVGFKEGDEFRVPVI